MYEFLYVWSYCNVMMCVSVFEVLSHTKPLWHRASVLQGMKSYLSIDIDFCMFFNDIKSYGVLGKSCVRFAMYQAITKSLQYRAFVLLGGKSHEFLRISCVHFAMYEVIRSLRSHRNVVCVLQGRKSYEVIVMSCVLQGRKSYEVIAMSWVFYTVESHMKSLQCHVCFTR